VLSQANDGVHTPAVRFYALEQRLSLVIQQQTSHLYTPTNRPVILGLAFLKYASDRFEACQQRFLTCFDNDDLALSPHLCREDYPDNISYADALEEAQRHYYKAHRVLWVSEASRWKSIRTQMSDLPAQDFSGVNILDTAFWCLEADNPSLKGLLDEKYVGYQTRNADLRQYINGIDPIDFGGV
jgi:type I restriction-modification system DNA methylase subunit